MKIRFFKAVISSIICLAISLGMVSCNTKNTVMQIGDIEISESIYSYWLSEAAQEYYELTDEEKNSEASDYIQWIRDRAYSYCLEYAAVTDKFNSLGLSLTVEQKNDIANNIVVSWGYWGDYFKKIGINKADYLKIFEYEEYKNSIFQSLYGSEGEFAVTDEELQNYFKENYVLFNVIAGYKTERDASGNIVQISDETKAALTASFESMASKINDDTLTFDQVYYQYNSSVSLTDEEVKQVEINESQKSSPNIITMGNASYPESFFEDISAIEDGDAKVLEYDDYVYLVVKLDILGDDLMYFENYRQTCLRLMKSEDYSKQLADWEDSLSEQIDINEHVINKIDIDSYLELISR